MQGREQGVFIGQGSNIGTLWAQNSPHTFTAATANFTAERQPERGWLKTTANVPTHRIFCPLAWSGFIWVRAETGARLL